MFLSKINWAWRHIISVKWVFNAHLKHLVPHMFVPILEIDLHFLIKQHFFKLSHFLPILILFFSDSNIWRELRFRSILGVRISLKPSEHIRRRFALYGLNINCTFYTRSVWFDLRRLRENVQSINHLGSAPDLLSRCFFYRLLNCLNHWLNCYRLIFFCLFCCL